jgi:hypothetical protein
MVGKVLDRGTKDSLHIYLQFFWRTDQMGYQVEDKPYHDASELIMSNIIDIVDAMTMARPADVTHDRSPALVHLRIHRSAPCVRDRSWMLSCEHEHGFSSFAIKRTYYLERLRNCGLCHVSFCRFEYYTVSAISSHRGSKVDGLIVHVPRTPPDPPRRNGRALFDSNIHRSA